MISIMDNYRTLACAVIERAIRDALGKPIKATPSEDAMDPEEAKAWLIDGGDRRFWFDLAGIKLLTPHELDQVTLHNLIHRLRKETRKVVEHDLDDLCGSV